MGTLRMPGHLTACLSTVSRKPHSTGGASEHRSRDGGWECGLRSQRRGQLGTPLSSRLAMCQKHLRIPFHARLDHSHLPKSFMDAGLLLAHL